ncbi:hypothetical protein LAZ67_20000682 [Cordylochernes scorpioides]|uniref:Uncharacterized protein n=1 Tax=Cordylochernes scorpioides TaxID=51811 RepID=A0ABY6LJC9_9ARAC|nr:hypothetical protein LAZ67_20000682 [Cordylochernes scorpioides]
MQDIGMLLWQGLDQLDEIRKSSLARLMCDNTEGIVRLQPLAFIRATN